MWWDPLTSWVISLFISGGALAREKLQKSIPAEYWGNKELYQQDVLNGVPPKQRMKNLEEGKYIAPICPEPVYPEPHRDPTTGKIIIENCELYNEDCSKYGAYQADIWMKQGKYNLTPEELKKEEARLKAKYERLYKL